MEDIIQRKGKLKEKKKAGIITISVIVAAGMTIVAFLLYVRMKKLRKVGEKEKEELDLPIFDFATIAKATNDFLSNNQLGQGGFGPVYKGTLIEGQEIAVKTLSKNSRQGPEEFKNEVTLIAKLQHRNLVKLFGCCIRRDERIGYMSPEYAFDGLFSMKSDVFSFGVLVLEIVAGKRNRGFSHPEHDHNLLGHAWRLWMEERPLELIDNALGQDRF
ncbi:hypothetical protein SCA6_018508 [Theobroma cacao]